MTGTTRFTAILIGAVVWGFAASSAEVLADRGPITVADAVQPQLAAATDDEVSATCSKPRKRLWVEGEGWIVRRVTICR